MGLSFPDGLKTPDPRPPFTLLRGSQSRRAPASRSQFPLPRLRRRDEIVAGSLRIRRVFKNRPLVRPKHTQPVVQMDLVPQLRVSTVKSISNPDDSNGEAY